MKGKNLKNKILIDCHVIKKLFASCIEQIEPNGSYNASSLLLVFYDIGLAWLGRAGFIY